MSRQNKQAANQKRAKAFANGGPKATTPQHGKKAANRVYTAKTRSLAEFQEKNRPARKARPQ